MRGFFSGRKNFDKLRAGVQLNIHQVKNREYGINSRNIAMEFTLKPTEGI